MRTEFQEAIGTAARLEDASSMVMAIKRAVTSEIRAADPSVSVTFTDYFNHTLVPDLDLPTLKRRANAGGASITQVQLGRDDRVITYESKDGTDVLDDPGLQQAAVDLGITFAEKAVAALEGARSVGIDFAQKSAIGPTNAVFPLGALLRSALPLISELESGEIASLQAALKPPATIDDLFASQADTKDP